MNPAKPVFSGPAPGFSRLNIKARLLKFHYQNLGAGGEFENIQNP